ncbi:hypothetical protein J6590_056854 [Homalodisca vitripennis]|nr:hypothetical protein J6590_056854 [Homalodisca vitripennis]
MNTSALSTSTMVVDIDVTTSNITGDGNPSPPADTLSPIVFYAVFSTIFVVGLIGNSLLILIFARHKTMRTVPNTYIFNLAVADLLTILSCALAPLLDNTGETLPLFCKTFQVILESSMGVSAFTLTALSAERYYVIAHPLKNKVSSKTFTVCAVLSTWLISVSFVVGKMVLKSPGSSSGCVQMYDPSSFANTYTLIDFIVFYLIPVGVIADFYILMAYELYFGNRNFRKRSVSNSTNHLRVRKRIAGTVLVLVIMYAVCYFPYNFMSLKLYFDKDFHKNQVWSLATNIIFCVGCIHNCFNPVILYSLSKSFRGHFNNYLFYSIFRKTVPVQEEHTDCQCSRCSKKTISKHSVTTKV